MCSLRKSFLLTVTQALLVFVAAISLTGCFEEDCTSSSQFYCDGNVAKNCSAERRAYHKTDCGAVDLQCAVGVTEAFCALSSEPDERCVKPASGWCLEDGTQISCKEGFATSPFSSPCEICIEVEGESLCPATGVKDPRCPDEPGYNSACSGNTSLWCRHGYLMGSQECSEDRECAQGDCVLKSSP
ncbi:MAG: hypothetical protein GX607_12760 [Myxococcales bacterium]|nr:hypothetical protein [Myxococcales bacterium]